MGEAPSLALTRRVGGVVPRQRSRLVRVAVLLCLLPGHGGRLGAQARPADVVASRTCSDTLRHASRAPGRPPISRVPRESPRLTWRDGEVAWAEWRVDLGAQRVPITAIVVRLDPRRIALTLDIARVGDALGPWSIADSDTAAVVALNAGQFTDSGPWGWVVHRGREWQAPGAGALSAFVVVDTGGTVHVLSRDGAAAWTAGPARGAVREAFQSYPSLLTDGHLPPPLCRAGSINRGHRDIRLALGVRPDSSVLLVLTRYAPPAYVPDAAARLPIGPTTLEMAELMYRLGSRDAVMLDGGLSAQLRVRWQGSDRRWPGLRAVPLGLLGHPRQRGGSLAPAAPSR